MLAKLAELLFVEAVRRYIDTLPADQHGWLAGLRDPYVGRALALMHEHPAYPWTVDELARRVALGRSALASRFAGILDNRHELPHGVAHERHGTAPHNNDTLDQHDQ